jgi:hypothetical protein
MVVEGGGFIGRNKYILYMGVFHFLNYNFYLFYFEFE